MKKNRKKAQLKPVKEDAWQNMAVGIGAKGIDKNEGASVNWIQMPRGRAECLFAGDDLAGKIASVIPYDGTREGVTFKIDQNDTREDFSDTLKFVDNEFMRLDVMAKFCWAWEMARVYGGSLVYVSVDDGQEPDMPLNPQAVRSINSLYVMDRWDINIYTEDLVKDLADPNFGFPEFYHYNTSDSGTGTAELIKIHHSRVIRFHGELLPRRLFIRNGYWNDSIFNRLYNAIRNYSTGQETVAHILQEVNQGVYTIEGLNAAIAGDSSELVLNKLNFIESVRSSMRSVILDENDSFSYIDTGLSGIEHLTDCISKRIIAASGIPHTRLMGESPGASLGEGGRSELTDYYDNVKSQQEINLRQPISRITELIFNQSNEPISEPENFNFEFNPLYQESQREIVESRYKQAQIDEIYLREGVVDSFEIATSRFGSGEYSFETVIEETDRSSFDERANQNNPEQQNSTNDPQAG